MHFSRTLALRRILNSGFHPFQVIPKPDAWMKRERLNRFTAWQYASERNTVKGAYRKEDKIFAYLNMQREDERKLEKFHAEERLRTALAEHDMEYSKFKTVLSQSQILIDNICLSQLAIYEPRSFRSLVAFAKEVARQEGMSVIPDEQEFCYDVHVDNKLVLRKPFPRAVEYTRGASENHTIKPRKLRTDEY